MFKNSLMLHLVPPTGYHPPSPSQSINTLTFLDKIVLFDIEIGHWIVLPTPPPLKPCPNFKCFLKLGFGPGPPTLYDNVIKYAVFFIEVSL